MKPSVAIALQVIKILLFLGLGIFMLAAGDRLDMEPWVRIAWGGVCLLFAGYRVYRLVKDLTGEIEDEEAESTTIQE